MSGKVINATRKMEVAATSIFGRKARPLIAHFMSIATIAPKANGAR